MEVGELEGWGGGRVGSCWGVSCGGGWFGREVREKEREMTREWC